MEGGCKTLILFLFLQDSTKFKKQTKNLKKSRYDIQKLLKFLSCSRKKALVQRVEKKVSVFFLNQGQKRP